MAETYADATAAMAAWINARPTLVGLTKPLQLGAHLRKIGGGEPKAYAFLEENVSVRSDDSAENPDMMAALTAQVYGGTRESATKAAVALAEALSTELCGCQAAVPGAVLFVSDDIQGPSWFPDGDTPRLLLNWTVRMRPA